MDVHKESIDVAIADEREARHYGRIGGDAHSVDQLTGKLRSAHRQLMFVYEAGPCGFWLYRRLKAQGIECMVVSPSMTPRNAADRVKTDRRDAMRLARLRAPAISSRSMCPMRSMRRCVTWSGRARVDALGHRQRCAARSNASPPTGG